MPQVTLAKVAPEETLLVAVDKLQASGKSAIVVEYPAQPLIAELDVLLHLLIERGDIPLRDIEAKLTPRASLHGRTLKEMLASFGLTTQPSTVIAGCRLTTFSNTNVEIDVDEDWQVEVLTTRTVLCRCQKTPTHVFRPQSLLVRGKCNFGDGDVNCGSSR